MAYFDKALTSLARIAREGIESSAIKDIKAETATSVYGRSLINERNAWMFRPTQEFTPTMDGSLTPVFDGKTHDYISLPERIAAWENSFFQTDVPVYGADHPPLRTSPVTATGDVPLRPDETRYNFEHMSTAEPELYQALQKLDAIPEASAPNAWPEAGENGMVESWRWRDRDHQASNAATRVYGRIVHAAASNQAELPTEDAINLTRSQLDAFINGQENATAEQVKNSLNLLATKQATLVSAAKEDLNKVLSRTDGITKFAQRQQDLQTLYAGMGFVNNTAKVLSSVVAAKEVAKGLDDIAVVVNHMRASRPGELLPAQRNSEEVKAWALRRLQKVEATPMEPNTPGGRGVPNVLANVLTNENATSVSDYKEFANLYLQRLLEMSPNELRVHGNMFLAAANEAAPVATHNFGAGNLGRNAVTRRGPQVPSFSTRVVPEVRQTSPANVADSGQFAVATTSPTPIRSIGGREIPDVAQMGEGVGGEMIDLGPQRYSIVSKLNADAKYINAYHGLGGSEAQLLRHLNLEDYQVLDDYFGAYYRFINLERQYPGYLTDARVRQQAYHTASASYDQLISNYRLGDVRFTAETLDAAVTKAVSESDFLARLFLPGQYAQFREAAFQNAPSLYRQPTTRTHAFPRASRYIEEPGAVFATQNERGLTASYAERRPNPLASEMVDAEIPTGTTIRPQQRLTAPPPPSPDAPIAEQLRYVREHGFTPQFMRSVLANVPEEQVAAATAFYRDATKLKDLMALSDEGDEWVKEVIERFDEVAKLARQEVTSYLVSPVGKAMYEIALRAQNKSAVEIAEALTNVRNDLTMSGAETAPIMVEALATLGAEFRYLQKDVPAALAAKADILRQSIYDMFHGTDYATTATQRYTRAIDATDKLIDVIANRPELWSAPEMAPYIEALRMVARDFATSENPGMTTGPFGRVGIVEAIQDRMASRGLSDRQISALLGIEPEGVVGELDKVIEQVGTPRQMTAEPPRNRQNTPIPPGMEIEYLATDVPRTAVDRTFMAIENIRARNPNMTPQQAFIVLSSIHRQLTGEGLPAAQALATLQFNSLNTLERMARFLGGRPVASTNEFIPPSLQLQASRALGEIIADIPLVPGYLESAAFNGKIKWWLNRFRNQAFDAVGLRPPVDENADAAVQTIADDIQNITRETLAIADRDAAFVQQVSEQTGVDDLDQLARLYQATLMTSLGMRRESVVNAMDAIKASAEADAEGGIQFIPDGETFFRDGAVDSMSQYMTAVDDEALLAMQQQVTIPLDEQQRLLAEGIINPDATIYQKDELAEFAGSPEALPREQTGATYELEQLTGTVGRRPDETINLYNEVTVGRQSQLYNTAIQYRQLTGADPVDRFYAGAALATSSPDPVINWDMASAAYQMMSDMGGWRLPPDLWRDKNIWMTPAWNGLERIFRNDNFYATLREVLADVGRDDIKSVVSTQPWITDGFQYLFRRAAQSIQQTKQRIALYNAEIAKLEQAERAFESQIGRRVPLDEQGRPLTDVDGRPFERPAATEAPAQPAATQPTRPTPPPIPGLLRMPGVRPTAQPISRQRRTTP